MNGVFFCLGIDSVMNFFFFSFFFFLYYMDCIILTSCWKVADLVVYDMVGSSFYMSQN